MRKPDPWLARNRVRDPGGVFRCAGIGRLGAMDTARGTFDITMAPAPPEVDGNVDRFDFTKTFRGGLEATGAGIMLSVRNPQAGEAGYVAIETLHGRLNGTDGGFALQQSGTLHHGGQTLGYVVVPGSGSGSLAGITGELELTVDEDGTHRYKLDVQI